MLVGETLASVDAGVVVAIIALLGAVLSAVIAVYGQLRSTSIVGRREAEAVLARYREPLVGAAYELQAASTTSSS
jgi:hypothetical protein